jgi:hypothetical protein
MKFKVKILDILIILIAAGITFFTAYNIYMKPQGQAHVLIRGQGREWIFPLNAEETVFIHGPLGETKVRISDSRAWVETSPCRNQTCVASGIVMRHGSWAACLPNNVLIMVEGSKDESVDAIAW